MARVVRWCCFALCCSAMLAATGVSAAADASTAAKFKYPVPWTVTADKLYLFAINTPAAAPTHAPSYVGRPAWALEQPGSGRGFILVAKYSDSPAGPYSELIYLPGRFKPSSAGGVCSSAPFWSVQRIWVDSQMALMAGRSVWGYPKEMASFTWGSGKRADSVIVRNARNVTIFSAVASLNPSGRVPTWVGSSLDALKQVQWPVPVARGGSGGSEPLLAQLKFTTPGGFKAAKALRVFASGSAFTGRAADKLAAEAAALSVPAGSTCTLLEPTPLSC